MIHYNDSTTISLGQLFFKKYNFTIEYTYETGQSSGEADILYQLRVQTDHFEQVPVLKTTLVFMVIIPLLSYIFF